MFTNQTHKTNTICFTHVYALFIVMKVPTCTVKKKYLEKSRQANRKLCWIVVCAKQWRSKRNISLWYQRNCQRTIAAFGNRFKCPIARDCYFLFFIDKYSQFPEVAVVNSKKNKATNRKMKRLQQQLKDEQDSSSVFKWIRCYVLK